MKTKSFGQNFEDQQWTEYTALHYTRCIHIMKQQFTLALMNTCSGCRLSIKYGGN